MSRLIIVLLFLPLLIACTRGFKPPPNTFETWEKKGETLLDIKRALLECGYRNPSGGGNGWDMDTTILAQKCMLAEGYIQKSRIKVCSGWITSDGVKHENTSPACQPDAIIPTRSVERRLNSYYCTNYGKNTPECQPPGQESIPQKSSPADKPISGFEANDYFEQNRFREQTNQLQMDMQNNSNRQIEKMLKDTAPKLKH